MFRILMPIAFFSTFVILHSSGLGQTRSNQEQESTQESAASKFLDSLEGNWRMEGRFRPTKTSDWIPTRSTMVCKRRLGDRAVVREIEAAQISLEAQDVIWYDEAKDEFTYIYLSSTNSAPVIMTGKLTAENEITVKSSDESYKTVIRLESPDKMVAQDFIPGSDGEWLKRDINHYREKPEK